MFIEGFITEKLGEKQNKTLTSYHVPFEQGVCRFEVIHKGLHGLCAVVVIEDFAVSVGAASDAGEDGLMTRPHTEAAVYHAAGIGQTLV